MSDPDLITDEKFKDEYMKKKPTKDSPSKVWTQLYGDMGMVKHVSTKLIEAKPVWDLLMKNNIIKPYIGDINPSPMFPTRKLILASPLSKLERCDKVIRTYKTDMYEVLTQIYRETGSVMGSVEMSPIIVEMVKYSNLDHIFR